MFLQKIKEKRNNKIEFVLYMPNVGQKKSGSLGLGAIIIESRSSESAKPYMTSSEKL